MKHKRGNYSYSCRFLYLNGDKSFVAILYFLLIISPILLVLPPKPNLIQSLQGQRSLRL